MWIDYSSMRVPALKFVLQPSHEPHGIVEVLAPGLTACHSPWFTEVALEVTGVEGVAAAVVYVIPKDDDTSLLAACVDETVELLFSFMSGADHGDALTRLVAVEWPDIYAMLRDSQRGTPGQRILANVHTSTRVQWVVADELRGARREGIDPREAEELINTALKTVIRASQFYIELPGVMQVLGGPDRLSRRLKGVSTLFMSAADFGTGVMDGMQVDELVGLAKSVREFVGGLMGLKD